MSYLKKISFINFILLFGVSIIFIIYFRNFYDYPHNEQTFMISVCLAVLIILQLIINLGFSISLFSKDPEKKEKGKAHLLNFLLILVIGYPTCMFSAGRYL